MADGWDPVARAVWETWELELRRRGRRPATLAAYAQRLRAFTRELPGWQHATPAELERWLDARELAPATRRWWATLLAAFYAVAVREGVLERSPAAGLVRPVRVDPAPRPVPDADAATLLELAPGMGPEGKAVGLMLWAGLRCGEVARLTWADVDPAGVLYVTGKGGRTRWVPARPELLELLGPPGPPAAPVLGVPWTAANVGRRVRVVLRSYGIRHRVHELRTAAATAVYRATRDPVAVQRFLGHATLTPTMRYIGHDDEALRRAVLAVSFGGPDRARDVAQHVEHNPGTREDRA